MPVDSTVLDQPMVSTRLELIRLTSISRIEPEASLFEIPANYRISFTQHTPELGIKSQQ